MSIKFVSNCSVYAAMVTYNFFNSYEMMESTWQEDSVQRPSFTDIVCFLHQQDVKDTPTDEMNSVVVDSENDSGYLEIFQT